MTIDSGESRLNVATRALADAIAAVWRECDVLAEPGGNLAEELSFALGLAAKQLGAVSDGWDDDAAREFLVRHRPGSWEADHVRRLMFKLDLLP